MPDAPIRLTKRRAKALLEILGRGEDEERALLEDEFGVIFLADGTIEIVEDAELLEPGEMDDLAVRLNRLTDAMAAARIIRRRYT